MTKLAHRTFDTNGVSISYGEARSTRPVLVFVHGLTGSWREYAPFIERFTSEWHTYACDLRGHGLSSRAPDAYRLVDYVSDVTSLVDRINAPVVLVGHSLGALVSLGTAAQRGDRIRGLVLLDPIIRIRSLRHDCPQPVVQWLEWAREVAGSAKSLDDVIGAYKLATPDAAEADIVQAAESVFRVAPEAVDVALSDRLLDGMNIRETLVHVRCPTLLLRGDVTSGSVVRDVDLEFAHETLAALTVLRVPGASHMLHEEQPELVHEHIKIFLEVEGIA
jgi:pimeloyl-ACP methyl ester carboxylesterase